MGAGAAQAIGPIAGAVLGGVVGGPVGAGIGGSIGSGVGSAYASSRSKPPPSAGTGGGLGRGQVGGGGQNYGGVPPPITGQQAGDIVSKLLPDPAKGAGGVGSNMTLADYAKQYPDLFKGWPSWMLGNAGSGFGAMGGG